MHDHETIHQMIELRAQGISYERIADTLKIGKATALAWGRKYRARIENLRTVHLEALQEEILGRQEDRARALLTRLRELEQTLLQRQVKDIPYRELQELIQQTRNQLDRFRHEPSYSYE